MIYPMKWLPYFGVSIAPKLLGKSTYFGLSKEKGVAFAGQKGHSFSGDTNWYTSYAMSKRKLPLGVRVEGGNAEPTKNIEKRVTDLGNGSQVIYLPKFLPYEDSWKWLDYLNDHIPWTRPTIKVFGRSCLQPRDTCYVATPGLPELVYSGYQPDAYSWDDYPPLKELLDLVHEALPGSSFNSLLLNRYKVGNDYVGWHSDNEALYGPAPEIASISFGCERDFILKKKPSASTSSTVHCFRDPDETTSKRIKRSSEIEQHKFTLKHGSLLVMRGYTQRDWVHSVPKRAKADAVRINLTFRHVLKD